MELDLIAQIWEQPESISGLSGNSILTETGDAILTETGDQILTE